MANRIQVIHGDCRTEIPKIREAGVVVDSICCDPPYDLVAMTKRFGKNYAAAKSPDHQRFARGFMGQQWDGEGVAFDPETWRVLGSALRPGGFMLAFGAPRTHHRLASAIEDAGFVIQDCIMWLFATGFPKRRDALKPAYEPIVVAYKPGGARTLQVDECRIAASGESFGDPAAYAARSRKKADGWVRPHHGGDADAERTAEAIKKAETLGRWPANVCHDGSDEVLACFPESAGQQGDIRGTEPSCQVAHTNGIYGAKKTAPHRARREGEASADRRYTDETGFAMLPGARRSDAGSAARFYFSAKAGAQDRWGSKHPTVKPVELMKWLVPLVTPPGGLVLDPFAGSGTTGIAALATGRNCMLIERETVYCEDIRERLAFCEGSGMHSAAAKNRNRKRDGDGPLFEDWQEADAIGSYNEAVRSIGERVRNGGEIPEFFLPRRGDAST